MDLRPLGTDGARVEHTLEMISIACNKNTAPGDKSALKPGGIRLGTPALTSRNLKEKDFDQVVDFIHEGKKLRIACQCYDYLISRMPLVVGIQLTLKIQQKSGKLLKEFKDTSKAEEYKGEISNLKSRVESFAQQFPMPGFEDF